MNWLDRAIGIVAPRAAYRRVKYREALARYDAAKPSRFRKHITDDSSGDINVSMDAGKLRATARHLERNDDLSRAVVSVLTRNIVGANGIGVEPRPRLRDGEVDTDLGQDLQALWEDFSKRPEVTWSHSWASCQRLACRAWIRDGEALGQLLAGRVRGLNHGTHVPFSIELLEADVVPLDYDNPAKRIRQGIETNAWGRKLAYHIYKAHPGDWRSMGLGSMFPELKRVSADRIVHPYMTDRISQIRGVSLFAVIIARLFDVKDYEESERVAAKVAASMAGYIKKGSSDLYEEYSDKAPEEPRNLSFRAGKIFDDLLPGEEVGTIGSNRPSDRLTEFRASQLRAAAAGADVGYSSVTRDYNGTYSAQRQELVEQWSAYAVLADEFVSKFIRPVYERFVFTAAAAGMIRVPRDIDVEQLAAAEFRPPPMPWIDPVKEARAQQILRDARIKSTQQIIRERGGDWRDVFRQIAEEKEHEERLGLKPREGEE